MFMLAIYKCAKATPASKEAWRYGRAAHHSLQRALLFPWLLLLCRWLCTGSRRPSLILGPLPLHLLCVS